MTKQEAIKAFMEGKEIIIGVNEETDRHGRNQHHVTNREVANDHRLYVITCGPMPAKMHRNMYITGYIEDLEGSYKEIEGYATLTYRLA